MADSRGIGFNDVQSRNREEKRFSLRFFPQGTGDIVNTNNVGYGMTITRTDVGKFTAVFDKPCNKLVDVRINPQHATLVQHGRVISIQTDATTGAVTGFTFQIYTAANPGLAVELAAAATTWVGVEATVLNSAVR